MLTIMGSERPCSMVVLGGDPDLNALVFEALDKVAAPSARDAVIEQALELAGSEPVELESLLTFVAGPLKEAAHDTLGTEAAGALISDVKPVLERVVRFRASTPPPPETMPPETMPPVSACDTDISAFARSASDTNTLGGMYVGETKITDASPASAGRPIRRHTLPYVSTAHDAPGFVLIVDDDAAFVRGFSRLLRLSGYDVVTAPDARTALRLCHRLQPSLVISDLEMPGMNGIELADEIVHTMRGQAPPVLLLTGATEKPEVPSSVLRMLSKSIRPGDLLAEIEPLLVSE